MRRPLKLLFPLSALLTLGGCLGPEAGEPAEAGPPLGAVSQAATPIGWLDYVGADSIKGWACDQDTPATSIGVHLYIGGAAGASTVKHTQAITANVASEAGVNSACGGGTAHRFVWPIPADVKSKLGNGSFPVYAYGINTNPSDFNSVLNGSPKTLTLSGVTNDFVTVNGSQLFWKGSAIQLKGTNLEAIAANHNNIWSNYWGHKGSLTWLFDRLGDMGGNSVRFIFPDGSIQQNADGSVPAAELDKLNDALAELNGRGQKAIVTLFNRHNWNGSYYSYGTADRVKDAAKVASFVQRFKNDARIALWDIANEPTMTTDQHNTLMWAKAMRDAIRNNGAVQPITIGADIHFALTYPAGDGTTMISLSDVVSLHCYARYKDGCTPAFADGVAYRDDGFCAASFQYIRNNTSKPMLLEEFGWVERDAPNWPPSHPWCIYNFPESDASMDDMYAQAFSAVDRKGVVGAIQWQLQDAPDFGLITSNGQYKRNGVPGSAFERFVQWRGSSVRKFF